jgi:hypothetical protein
VIVALTPLFRVVSKPESRLCGRLPQENSGFRTKRSLRTAMPGAFFWPTSSTSRLLPVMPVRVRICAPIVLSTMAISRKGLHALGHT